MQERVGLLGVGREQATSYHRGAKAGLKSAFEKHFFDFI